MPILDIREAMPKLTLALKTEVVNIKPPSDIGFRQFFKEVTHDKKGYKFYVRKGKKRVSVDRHIYERGQHVRTEDATQVECFPGYFDEYTDYSAFDEYENVVGFADSVDATNYQNLVAKVAETMADSEASFDRAEELMCAQLLQTGIVTLKCGDNLVFPRDAESIIAYNAEHDFSIPSVNPEIKMSQAARFLINKGYYSNGRFIAIMAEDVWIDFKNNPIVQDQADLKDASFMNLETGNTLKQLVPQGLYTAGAHKFNIFTYDAEYDHPVTGVKTKYLDPKAMIVMPEKPDLEFVYCGLPKLVGKQGQREDRIIKEKRLYYRHEDERACSIEMGVMSAFMPVLSNVDSVVTITTRP